METDDSHYYEEIGGITKPTYDWEHYILTPAIKRVELDFFKNKKELNPEGLKQFRNFIHEYIHYLQNFSTNWGVYTAMRFFGCYQRIGAASAFAHEKVKLPLDPNNYSFQNDVLQAGFKDRIELIDSLTLSDDLKQDHKKKYKETEAYFENNRLIFDNGPVHRTVGLKCIREHMAFLAEQLFLGNDDSAILTYINTNTGFINEEGNPVFQSEYWIMFQFYASKYQTILEIGPGLFCLMRECLTRLNPDLALYRFHKFFISFTERGIMPKKFIDFVNLWVISNIENEHFKNSCELTNGVVEEIIRNCDRLGNNSLLLGMKEIGKMTLVNLKTSTGGRHLFGYPSPKFSELLYWNDLILEYGTSIVNFQDEVAILGNHDHIEKLYEPFSILNATTITIKKLHEQQEFSCPYFSDINMCLSQYKNPDICDHKPFQIRHKIVDGKHCQLSSGLFVLGFNERIVD